MLHIHIREHEDMEPERLVKSFSADQANAPETGVVDFVEALASAMTSLARAQADDDTEALIHHADRLERTAAGAGLPRLRRAAASVLICIARRDRVGTAATVERCRRLGDSVFTTLWTAGQRAE